MDTWYKDPKTFTSDKKRIKLHYHINQWVELHQHEVFWGENSWFHETEYPLPNASEIKLTPAVMPGTRPANEKSFNRYVERVINENHPADADIAYEYILGEFKH